MNGLDGAVAVLRAAGDATRLRILAALGERSLCVCELVALVDVGQPAVSRHLGILQDAGLVESVRDGRFIDYRLPEPAASGFAGVVLRGLAALAQADPDAVEVRARARLVDRRELGGPLPSPCGAERSRGGGA